MTDREFADWWRDYCTAFPDTARWANDLPDRPATMRLWFDVLQSTTLDDAKEVTRRMLRGDDDRVLPFDREDTPRHVARLARAVKSRRESAGVPEYKPEYLAVTKPSFSCRQAMQDILSGKAPTFAADDDNEPRYRCLQCRDGGLVTVWEHASVVKMRRGTFRDRPDRRTTAVRCTCEAGKRRYPSVPEYDPRLWRTCNMRPTDADVEDLRESCRTLRPAGYVHAFDEWNESP